MILIWPDVAEAKRAVESSTLEVTTSLEAPLLADHANTILASGCEVSAHDSLLF